MIFDKKPKLHFDEHRIRLEHNSDRIYIDYSDADRIGNLLLNAEDNRNLSLTNRILELQKKIR